MAVGGSGKGEYHQQDSLTDHQDGRLLGAGRMAQLPPPTGTSPAMDPTGVSELPATPSQQSVNSGATPASRHIVSMPSSSGAGGRESEISGFTVSAQQSPQLKEQSPLIHQSLFELEDSSSRTFVGRRR
ncbi:hypothetical protein Trco_007106 [Trichoderma cornu-damae]|uniref:Uncharacterized protein n=1 Tax=Trichoderma cornu-damae TaxID=654480 RepID=A0A9P8QHX6_9HYPO|nr:hypothetical protein Trco_007106 [Trichoderma cornu-damae]